MAEALPGAAGRSSAARRALRGSDQDKRWIADPNGPKVDPVDMLYAFLHKADRVEHQSPEMQRAPELEHEDALVAAHMISLARHQARDREITVMRKALEHGVTWEELAYALETTVEDLQQTLR